MAEPAPEPKIAGVIPPKIAGENVSKKTAIYGEKNDPETRTRTKDSHNSPKIAGEYYVNQTNQPIDTTWDEFLAEEREKNDS